MRTDKIRPRYVASGLPVKRRWQLKSIVDPVFAGPSFIHTRILESAMIAKPAIVRPWDSSESERGATDNAGDG